MILVRFQGKQHNITVIQIYAPTIDAEEAEVDWFYKDLQEPLELIPKKGVLFIIGDWNDKVESQEITWSKRQVWPWSKNESGQRLAEFCQANTHHFADKGPYSQSYCFSSTHVQM